jgi:hypothetical protein
LCKIVYLINVAHKFIHQTGWFISNYWGIDKICDGGFLGIIDCDFVR